MDHSDSGLVLIGGPDPPERIVIVDYDEQWPHRFETLADRIRVALGEEVTIEHIGSTAVPGLPAKPIIDVLLVVDDVDDESVYVAPLRDAGFALRAREAGHRLFRTPTLDAHVHVYQSGAEEIAAYLRLRSRLRVSASDRELYASTKRRLAQQRWDTMQDYAVAKTEVIADILNRAEPDTGWPPDNACADSWQRRRNSSTLRQRCCKIMRCSRILR